MKKLFCLIVVALLVCTLFAGCNQQLLDTTYSYESCQVLLPDGTVVSGKCSGWKDWENSDAIQVVVDGKTYYTHMSNVVLISE